MRVAAELRGPGPLVRMLKTLVWLIALAVAVPVAIVLALFTLALAPIAYEWGVHLGSGLCAPRVLGSLAPVGLYGLLLAATRRPRGRT
jgi:lysylphosphatidylglycerol synthetase-like protein (DUF2156 family)